MHFCAWFSSTTLLYLRRCRPYGTMVLIREYPKWLRRSPISSGYSTNRISLDWIYLFGWRTRGCLMRQNETRLLLFDSHGSHLTYEFLQNSVAWIILLLSASFLIQLILFNRLIDSYFRCIHTTISRNRRWSNFLEGDPRCTQENLWITYYSRYLQKARYLFIQRGSGYSAFTEG